MFNFFFLSHRLHCKINTIALNCETLKAKSLLVCYCNVIFVQYGSVVNILLEANFLKLLHQ